MDRLIDFTPCHIKSKMYDGANGGKLCIVYQGNDYMLKFPGPARQNARMHYSNSCVSEYLGCHIFNAACIPAQDTLLGIYRQNEKEYSAVACRDFTAGGKVFQNFASLKNTVIMGTPRSGAGTELGEVLETIEMQSVIDAGVLMERFWEMFVVDAFIGNWDRHNGNWGFLYDPSADTIALAPVFDCGSCLYPQADPSLMKKILDDPAEREARIYDRPVSALQIDGEKIRYYQYLTTSENSDCMAAVRKLVPLIERIDIDSLIGETPALTDLDRLFYQRMLEERLKLILEPALAHAGEVR